MSLEWKWWTYNALKMKMGGQRQLNQRLKEHQKKTLRVKEAEERADQKEREKLQKSLEKSTKKGKKSMNPPLQRGGKSPLAPNPTYEYGSHGPTFSRGTKRDSSYEQLNQILILISREDLKIQLQELILNASTFLKVIRREFTPSYNEFKRFRLKILLFHNFFITCLHSNLCISTSSNFFIH